jgi:hypothetical protein
MTAKMRAWVIDQKLVRYSGLAALAFDSSVPNLVARRSLLSLFRERYADGDFDFEILLDLRDRWERLRNVRSLRKPSKKGSRKRRT